MLKKRFLLCFLFVSFVLQLTAQDSIENVSIKDVEYQNIYLDNLLISSSDSVVHFMIPSALREYYYDSLLIHKQSEVREVIEVNNEYEDHKVCKELFFYSQKARGGFCMINKIISKRVLEISSTFSKNEIKINYLYNGRIIRNKKDAQCLMNIPLDHVELTGIFVDTLQSIIDVEFYDYRNESRVYRHHLFYSFYDNYHYFPQYWISRDYDIITVGFQDNLQISRNYFKTKVCGVFLEDVPNYYDDARFLIHRERGPISIYLNNFCISDSYMLMYNTEIAQGGYLYINDFVNDCFFEHYIDYPSDSIHVEYVYNHQKATKVEDHEKIFTLSKHDIRVQSIFNNIAQSNIIVYFTSMLNEYDLHKKEYLLFLNY